MDSNKNTENDEELDHLLQSAFNDLIDLDTNKQPSTSKGKPDLVNEDKEKSTTDNSGVDDIISSLFEKDHFAKLSESCKKAVEAKTDDELESSLSETLLNLTESAKSLGENHELFDEELSKLWQQMGLNDNSSFPNPNEGTSEGLLPDVMELITDIMQKFLSKEFLYPSLQELCAKYPQWLNDNTNKIDSSELNRYRDQYELLKQVCAEFEEEQENDPKEVKKERFLKVMSIMEKIKHYGYPPNELVGHVRDSWFSNLDFTNLDNLDMSKFSSLANNPPGSTGCSLM